MDSERLSSLIYEAALVPERWIDFVDLLANEVSAFGAVLFTAGVDAQLAIVSNGLFPVWQDFASGGWNITNPRLDRALQLKPVEFIRDRDVLSAHEIATHPWFTEFCAKWDMGEAAGAVFSLPSGATLVLSIERHTGAGSFSDTDIANLNSLRPDLGRSVDLTIRLAHQRYENQTGVLNAVGLAAAVIDAKGRMLSANALFEDLMPHAVREARGRLQLASKSANALLEAAIGRLPAELWLGTPASIALPATFEFPEPAVLHLIPIRGLAHDIICGGACLLVVCKVGGVVPPAEMLLRNLFDLSAAEARVARSLIMTRGDYRATASELGVGVETVRTHAKSVYRKTGITGTAELVAMGVRLTRVDGEHIRSATASNAPEGANDTTI